MSFGMRVFYILIILMGSVLVIAPTLALVGNQSFGNNTRAFPTLEQDSQRRGTLKAATSSSVNIKVQSKLMELTQHSVDHVVSNHYVLGGGEFDIKKGIYQVDCSEYIDHLLKSATPDAYKLLKHQMGTLNPISEDYFKFFTSLPENFVHKDWYRVMKVSALKPGDILVFHYKNLMGHHTAGHVMMVVAHPQLEYRQANIYRVRVADAAPSGHSYDTRPTHTSGIGIGTLLLKVNPRTGAPIAYAWTVRSPWENDMLYAMGRPMSK